MKKSLPLLLALAALTAQAAFAFPSSLPGKTVVKAAGKTVMKTDHAGQCATPSGKASRQCAQGFAAAQASRPRYYTR
jgi:hypothetical protein